MQQLERSVYDIALLEGMASQLNIHEDDVPLEVIQEITNFVVVNCSMCRDEVFLNDSCLVFEHHEIPKYFSCQVCTSRLRFGTTSQPSLVNYCQTCRWSMSDATPNGWNMCVVVLDQWGPFGDHEEEYDCPLHFFQTFVKKPHVSGRIWLADQQERERKLLAERQERFRKEQARKDLLAKQADAEWKKLRKEWYPKRKRKRKRKKNVKPQRNQNPKRKRRRKEEIDRYASAVLPLAPRTHQRPKRFDDFICDL